MGEDDPSEWDDDEYEHWYPHWKLLGLRMHGLYTLDEFCEKYEYYGDSHKTLLPLSIDHLNSLFGFSANGTGKALHSEALWEPDESQGDLLDPQNEQWGFTFLPLKGRVDSDY